jgi:hypothetical protein
VLFARNEKNTYASRDNLIYSFVMLYTILFRSVVNFFRWIFRQSFIVVVLTAMGGFLFVTMSFALFIWIAGSYEPECVGGVDFSKNGDNYFTDAFILSWTTFATVVRTYNFLEK